MFRDSCLCWNEAAASIPGWPSLQVEVPNGRKDFAFKEEAFPASYRKDLEVYLAQRTAPDVFADNWSRPLRPITARQRRGRLLLLATALVASGLPIDRITGLDVLVQPNNAKALLRYLYDRNGGKASDYLVQLATLLKTVARHYVGADEAHLKALGTFVQRLSPHTRGFTPKNRVFYRQFADQRLLGNLLQLPYDVVARIERRNDGFRDSAAQFALALAIAILLIKPLRISNLLSLRLDKHLHRIRRPGEDVVLLSIPPEETKNSSADNAELPRKLPSSMTSISSAIARGWRSRAPLGSSPAKVAATARRVASAPSCATSSITRSASR